MEIGNEGLSFEVDSVSCEIPGVCTIRFENSNLHRLYASRVKELFERLQNNDGNECEDNLSEVFRVDKKSDNFIQPSEHVYESLRNNSLVDEADLGGQNKQLKCCFNCLEEHLISECPFPIDKKAVAENRRKHHSKQTTSNTRFFEDEEQRSKFKAGQWSHRLLEALDVQSDEVPMFVYRMRVLGYPPGWLEESKIHFSGLKMFDGTENDIAFAEDGEVDRNSPDSYYDTKQLLDIPGFNVPLPKGVADECRKFGMPPMQLGQSKVATLENMENGEDKNLKSYSKRASKRKRSLPSSQKILPTENSTDTTNEGGDALSGGQSQDGKTAPGEANLPSANGALQETTFGIPLPKCTTDGLPSSENWSKGVAEHIPYENLPGATGTFDKMREILSKIKNNRNDTGA